MMEFLNSAWLIRMMEQAGPRPTDKLLSLYTLLETWLQAPGIRQGLETEIAACPLLPHSCPALNAYLLSLASAVGLRNPTIVVNQLMILLQGAMAEELRNPGMGALLAAQQAARVVIRHSRPSMMARMDNAIRNSAYAAACIMATVLTVHFWPASHAPQDTQAAQASTASGIEPALLLKAFALRKNMESGACPTPHFFSMPKEQIPVYLDIVHSRLAANPDMDNNKLATFLTWYEQQRAWECYPKAQINQRFISRI